MNGRYENGALPEKVRLLYEAVLAMVTDGWDINRMKVSDITAQAGIGKGTAYEYFSSKEEIIANAVLYDVEMRLAHVLEITKGEGDFAGKFVQILTYMEEVFAKRQAFCLLVRIGLVRMRSLSPCAGNVKRDSRLWAAIWRIGLWSP